MSVKRKKEMQSAKVTVHAQPRVQRGSVRTAGSLRNFLADVMVDIRNGEIDTQSARNIAQLADQINNSFFAEARVAAIALASGQAPETSGAQPLNGSTTTVHVRKAITEARGERVQ